MIADKLENETNITYTHDGTEAKENQHPV